jgi:hypothetical protein
MFIGRAADAIAVSRNIRPVSDETFAGHETSAMENEEGAVMRMRTTTRGWGAQAAEATAAGGYLMRSEYVPETLPAESNDTSNSDG